MWVVSYTAAAKRDLKKLPVDAAAALVRAVELFAATGQGDVGRMKGVEPQSWRLRVGEWRAVFQRDKATVTVIVIKAGHRREIYDR